MLSLEFDHIHFSWRSSRISAILALTTETVSCVLCAFSERSFPLSQPPSEAHPADSSETIFLSGNQRVPHGLLLKTWCLCNKMYISMSTGRVSIQPYHKNASSQTSLRGSYHLINHSVRFDQLIVAISENWALLTRSFPPDDSTIRHWFSPEQACLLKVWSIFGSSESQALTNKTFLIIDERGKHT